MGTKEKSQEHKVGGGNEKREKMGLKRKYIIKLGILHGEGEKFSMCPWGH